MKTLRNYVQLIGNLGQDVELTQFETGTKVAKFTMATHDYYKGKNGEKKENTQWHNIIAWGKLAELCEDNLAKGDHVILKGQLTYRSYEDKNGNKRQVTEVILSEFIKIN